MNILPLNNNYPVNNPCFGSFIIHRSNFYQLARYYSCSQQGFVKPNCNPALTQWPLTKEGIKVVLNKFEKFGKIFKKSKHVDVIADALELHIKQKSGDRIFISPFFNFDETKESGYFTFYYKNKEKKQHSCILGSLTKKETDNFITRIKEATTQMDQAAIIAEALEVNLENASKISDISNPNSYISKILKKEPLTNFSKQIKNLLKNYGL